VKDTLEIGTTLLPVFRLKSFQAVYTEMEDVFVAWIVNVIL